jgi:hypothetical protein
MELVITIKSDQISSIASFAEWEWANLYRGPATVTKMITTPKSDFGVVFLT